MDGKAIKLKIPEDASYVTIEDDGEYELSKTKNGVTKIRFYKNFINTDEATEILGTLKTEINWQERFNPVFKMQEPRLTARQGDYRYMYWNIEWGPSPFTKTVEMLSERLSNFFDYNFNSVIANYYRNGKDTVPWHSDDEPMLGKEPLIASLSFGETRIFELRPLQKENTPDDYSLFKHIKIPLGHGSLVTMEGSCQQDWEHKIPVCDVEGSRINLTYRITYPS